MKPPKMDKTITLFNFTLTIVILLYPIKTLSNRIYTAGDNIKVDRFAFSDGLSNNHITCALQDYLGFLWVGTGSGLNIYVRSYFHIFP